MVCRSLRLLSVAVLCATAAGAQPAAGGANPAAQADPAFDFVLGKMALFEGAARDAVASFESALRADPADPYLHFEFASLLLRQAEFSPANRGPLLKRAIEQAGAAVAGAPDDVDILRLLGRAQMALAESDDTALPAARSAFEAVLARSPEDLPSLAALGQIYLALGEAAKAADVLTVASRLRPDASALSSALLEALLKAERKDEATALLRRKLGEDATDLQSRLALADLESDAGHHRAAAELLRSTAGEQRTSSDVRRRLAIEEYHNGAVESALAEIEPLLAAEPGYVGGHYLRGLLLSTLARNAEAEKEFAELLQKTPESVDFALNLARVIERQGRRAEANAFLQETLRRLESASQGTANGSGAGDRLRIALALSAARAKDWAAVETSLRPMLAAGARGELRDEALFIAADARIELHRGDEALALLAGRDEAPFAAKRCELLQRLARADAARDCFERLTQAPGGDGLVEAADARQRLDDFAGSIPLLERARERVSEPTEVDYRLASAYERTGQRQPALGLLRGILERRPDFAPALNYLGYMLAEKGENLQEAVGLAERAVELDPGNGAYVDSLGWAHFQLRQFAQARLYLERAAGLVPDDATIREHLGDVYAAVGDTQKARAVYRQALDLGGDNAPAVELKLRGLPGGS